MAESDKYRLTTVRQVLEYYMDNHGLHVESWKDLQNMTRMFISAMGDMRLSDLQLEHFAAYKAARCAGRIGKRKAKATGTLRREFTHLVTAIKFCVNCRMVNPEHAPYIPIPEASPDRDRWLDLDEIRLLKEAAEPWSRGELFLRIALATAARRNVIETLEWYQVNFATGMITFLKRGERQTKKKKPTVPMPNDLRLYLEQWRMRQAAEPSQYVLGHTGSITRALEAIAKRAKVEGVTPHVLRHTWATHASMNGVSLEEIARILGDTIATVERVYAKFQPGYLRNAIERAVL